MLQGIRHVLLLFFLINVRCEGALSDVSPFLNFKSKGPTSLPSTAEKASSISLILGGINLVNTINSGSPPPDKVIPDLMRNPSFPDLDKFDKKPLDDLSEKLKKLEPSLKDDNVKKVEDKFKDLKKLLDAYEDIKDLDDSKSPNDFFDKLDKLKNLNPPSTDTGEAVQQGLDELPNVSRNELVGKLGSLKNNMDKLISGDGPQQISALGNLAKDLMPLAKHAFPKDSPQRKMFDLVKEFAKDQTGITDADEDNIKGMLKMFSDLAGLKGDANSASPMMDMLSDLAKSQSGGGAFASAFPNGFADVAKLLAVPGVGALLGLLGVPGFAGMLAGGIGAAIPGGIPGGVPGVGVPGVGVPGGVPGLGGPGMNIPGVGGPPGTPNFDPNMIKKGLEALKPLLNKGQQLNKKLDKVKKPDQKEATRKRKELNEKLKKQKDRPKKKDTDKTKNCKSNSVVEKVLNKTSEMFDKVDKVMENVDSAIGLVDNTTRRLNETMTELMRLRGLLDGVGAKTSLNDAERIRGEIMKKQAEYIRIYNETRAKMKRVNAVVSTIKNAASALSGSGSALWNFLKDPSFSNFKNFLKCLKSAAKELGAIAGAQKLKDAVLGYLKNTTVGQIFENVTSIVSSAKGMIVDLKEFPKKLRENLTAEAKELFILAEIPKFKEASSKVNDATAVLREIRKLDNKKEELQKFLDDGIKVQTIIQKVQDPEERKQLLADWGDMAKTKREVTALLGDLKQKIAKMPTEVPQKLQDYAPVFETFKDLKSADLNYEPRMNVLNSLDSSAPEVESAKEALETFGPVNLNFLVQTKALEGMNETLGQVSTGLTAFVAIQMTKASLASTVPSFDYMFWLMIASGVLVCLLLCCIALLCCRVCRKRRRQKGDSKGKTNSKTNSKSNSKTNSKSKSKSNESGSTDKKKKKKNGKNKKRLSGGWEQKSEERKDSNEMVIEESERQISSKDDPTESFGQDDHLTLAFSNFLKYSMAHYHFFKSFVPHSFEPNDNYVLKMDPRRNEKPANETTIATEGPMDSDISGKKSIMMCVIRVQSDFQLNLMCISVAQHIILQVQYLQLHRAMLQIHRNAVQISEENINEETCRGELNEQSKLIPLEYERVIACA